MNRKNILVLILVLAFLVGVSGGWIGRELLFSSPASAGNAASAFFSEQIPETMTLSETTATYSTPYYSLNFEADDWYYYYEKGSGLISISRNLPDGNGKLSVKVLAQTGAVNDLETFTSTAMEKLDRDHSKYFAAVPATFNGCIAFETGISDPDPEDTFLYSSIVAIVYGLSNGKTSAVVAVVLRCDKATAKSVTENIQTIKSYEFGYLPSQAKDVLDSFQLAE